MTPRLAATTIVALFVIGPACAGEPAFVALDVPTVTVDPDGTAIPSVPSTSLAEVDVADGPVAVGTQPATRLHNAAPVVAVGPPPTVPPRPGPVSGQCDTWEPWFTKYGMPWSEFERIVRRESNCSHAIADRPSTGDLSAGAAQVNFYGYLNAMWEASGWSWEMVRDDPEAAVAAAGALYRMCGSTGPWRPPYSCGGNVLPTPTEMGYLP